jgi:hypothetical protein
MDEVRMYARALEDHEILSSFKSRGGRPAKPWGKFKGHWKQKAKKKIDKWKKWAQKSNTKKWAKKWKKCKRSRSRRD